jgi:hypothetical protein
MAENPSTAHYDRHGVYQHDPLNQPLAEHEKNGNLGAHDLGQREHITRISGYCEHLILGGCEKDGA